MAAVPWKKIEPYFVSAFEAFGQVASATVVKDRYTGHSKGFGFVEMNSDSEARAAITGMNGKDLKGRPIRVDEARPPRPR